MGPGEGRVWTEQELLSLPDNGFRHELVDGSLRPLPASHLHGVIAMRIAALLMRPAQGRGYISGSSAGFRMRYGNIRSPDVGFTLKSRLPDGKPPKGFGALAPDLCVEIVSPSEEPGDMARKVREYFDAGAQQVWHLFPDSQSANVFASPEESVTDTADDEITAGDLLPGFRCRVADLFELE